MIACGDRNSHNAEGAEQTARGVRGEILKTSLW